MLYTRAMSSVRRIWPTFLLILLLAAGGVFWLKHDPILDWLAARGYEPSAQVERLTVHTTMKPYAKRLFYANRPVLEGKQDFNKHCTDPSEQVAVLGCFTGNRRGIYLYDVTDPRLDGIEQVTAAHEMLHQAYLRLEGAEKTRINGLLQEYHDLKASQKLKDKIASYKHTEPNELQNEMHSIFGTEASDLPAELEEYYKQYFTDRRNLLVYYTQSQAAFETLRNQITAYDKELEALKAQIDIKKDDLTVREKVLEQRRAQLDAYLAANQVEEYNAAVPPFNALVIAYRAEVERTNNLIEEFNRVLAERNTIAVQEHQLEEALDSSVNTAPRQ
jgi:hypothetical protein